MIEYNSVTVIYLSTLSKARCQNFHQCVLDIFKSEILNQEEEIRQIVTQYEQDVTAMNDVVGLYRGFDTTPIIKKIVADIDTKYRYFYRILKSFELEYKQVSRDEFSKLNHEVIEVFPLSILRLPLHERLGVLSALVTHLRTEWLPFLEKVGLLERYNEISVSVDQFIVALTQKVDEVSKKEKGEAKRRMNELAFNYHILVSYLEAWGNNWSDDPEIEARRKKAASAINQCNEVIAELRHSMAVAKSNRRRATAKPEA